MPANTTGQWGALNPWPFIGMHATVLPDGKVLTFGVPKDGFTRSFMHDIYDPVTGTHQTMTHVHTGTELVCSGSLIIPGTDQVIMVGGRGPAGTGGVDNTNIFDQSANAMAAVTPSDYGRWYATIVALPTGQIVALGGLGDVEHNGNAVPEIYTPGEGWRPLPGAIDVELGIGRYPEPAYMDNGTSQYPQAWVGPTGEIIYYANGTGYDNETEIYALDPSGQGSLRQVGVLPFAKNWDSPAIMYDTGKVLVMAENGDLWRMDISGTTPNFTKVGSIPDKQDWANMTVLADGTVMITGGGDGGIYETGADLRAVIWNPDTGAVASLSAEQSPRLYHSTSLLLADGTVMSAGGTSVPMTQFNVPGAAPGFHPDMQIFKPPYLFDANGNLAVRPVVSGAPKSVEPGDTFTITVDNANAIREITFSKTGSATHSFNMDARFVDLDFRVVNGTTIEVTIPENANEVVAGSWMMFAWSDKGVPSIAPIIAVQPTVEQYEGADWGVRNGASTGDILVNSSFETIAGAHPAQPTYRLLTNDQVTGWTSSTNQIEVWNDGFLGALGTDGRNVVEIDAVNGELSQFARTEAGKVYEVSFDYAGRAGFTASSSLEVLWNGQVIGVVKPQDTTFKTHEFYVTGTGGSDKLTFRSIAGDTDAVGGLLDDVSVAPVSALLGDGPGPVNPAPVVLLSNGSFENAAVQAATTGSWALTNAQVPSWTSSTNRIELWNNNFGGVAGTDGKIVAQVDAQTGVLSQTIKTEAGKYYGISFDYAGMPNLIASSKMEVLFNGVVIGTITPTDAVMKNYHFHVHGTGGNDVLGFRAVAGDTDVHGGLLDKVEFYVSGHGENPVTPIVGTAGDDSIVGTAGADRMEGLAGNDTYTVNHAGDVIVEAVDAGWDEVATTLASYMLGANVEGVKYTGAGAFTGTGNALGNLLSVTGSGNATLDGGAGDDSLYGADGVDTLRGGTGSDQIFTGGGASNRVFAGEGDDYIYGGAGADEIDLDAGNDTVYAGGGNDTIRGGAGNDVIYGDGGNNWIDGGDGDDQIFFSTDASTAFGGAGADTFFGNTAGDTMNGGLGNDIVYANGGNDIIDGGEGDDLLWGDAGNDVITGGAGADALWGGDGNDILIGGAGQDWFDGNAGADIFRFTAADGLKGDGIGDFTPGEDKIELSGFANLRSFADVQARLHQAEGFVWLDGGPEDPLYLHGVTVDQLKAGDFVFS